MCLPPGPVVVACRLGGSSLRRRRARAYGRSVTPFGPDRPSDEDLARTVDHLGVTRLQHAYADGINRRDWAAVTALFAPGARIHLDLVDRGPIELDGPDELVAFIEPAMARFTFFSFAILSSHVELWPGGDGDAATARLAMCELRTDDAGEESRAFGLYRDRYVRSGAGWRFADRRYQTLARSPGATAFPHPGV